jgi:hypothetical protein
MKPQSRGSPENARFRDSHAGVPGQNGHLDATPRRVIEYTIRGKVVASPQGPGRGESCVSVLPVACPNTKGIPNEF